MNFPHYVLDYENIFETVIDEFADSILAELRLYRVLDVMKSKI